MHFSCMVKISEFEASSISPKIGIASLNEILNEKMAPFKEEAENEFLAFHNVEEECRKEWEEESTDMIRMPDGAILFPWDDEFRISGGSHTFGSDSHQIPLHLKKEVIPYKEKYPTLEAFIEKFYGHEKDEKNGCYGYYHNPNAKLDWCVVGGRWPGELHLKKRGMGIRGKESAFEKYLINDPYRTDAARFRDIDWDSMSSGVNFRMESFYRDVEEVRRLVSIGSPSKEESNRRHEMSLDIHYALYDLDLLNKDERGFAIKDFTLEDLKRDYREEWMFHTYAVLDEEGNWYEKGKNAHWWLQNFTKKFIERTDPTTWIVIIDYHI